MMTCAACDDCPADAWHLHVTVAPHRTWSHVDVVHALTADITKIGMRPIVITNHFRDGRRPYKELIPTKHVRGTEARATHELFRMGTLLNNSGWRVRRLKIEGNPLIIKDGRALYYEAHVKNPARSLDDYRVPLSKNARGDSIYTFRYATMFDLKLNIDKCLDRAEHTIRIEAAVLDTAPELDHDWINQ